MLVYGDPPPNDVLQASLDVARRTPAPEILLSGVCGGSTFWQISNKRPGKNPAASARRINPNRILEAGEAYWGRRSGTPWVLAKLNRRTLIQPNHMLVYGDPPAKRRPPGVLRRRPPHARTGNFAFRQPRRIDVLANLR